MKSVICITLATITCVLAASVDINPLSDEYIDYLNSLQLTWKAGRNFDKDTPVSHIKSLLGTKKTLNREDYPTKVVKIDSETAIPDTFDAREAWPNCRTIKSIADQSNCGSCWAVATASAMSDRLCIKSNGDKQDYISARDLMSCCTLCGDGCEGGYPIRGWLHWQSVGLVTGGNYNSSEGCQPYPFAPCAHHVSPTPEIPACGEDVYDTPSCSNQCASEYGISFNDDIVKGSNAYFVNNNIEEIQQEILTNGPVVADFDVYSDFMTYKSGVYQKTAGATYEGGHAVRVIGWGTENNTPYWLIANSWNDSWGENGIFKMIRGKNNCGIEEEISAGEPNL